MVTRQVSSWHMERSTYCCFLSDLTRFIGSHCTSPNGLPRTSTLIKLATLLYREKSILARKFLKKSRISFNDASVSPFSVYKNSHGSCHASFMYGFKTMKLNLSSDAKYRRGDYQHDLLQYRWCWPDRACPCNRGPSAMPERPGFLRKLRRCLRGVSRGHRCKRCCL